ncbi:aldehyde dehydrogenase [Parahaliea maris]|uniref:Aldehyde dehydrogenase n=1 Tax=Parahaliea maris TaxID=2716870 RepID=A0A5C8ZQ33_9GAMM|nr:aldehyde dehydrogenase family protein [Parahaliea maris]TXS89829.1 aldehyde dehydrogenase [Parahaliea maris]
MSSSRFTITSRSPQDPKSVVCEVDATSPETVSKFATTAAHVGLSWGADSAAQLRADALVASSIALESASEYLANLMVEEVGKPINEARAELARAVSFARYFAQQPLADAGTVYRALSVASATSFSVRRPAGVAGLITPWNFPVLIPIWKIFPALAYGNGVLWKPSEEATCIALALSKLLSDHLPEGLLSVLPGGADTGRAVLEQADVLSFTGSVEVGHLIIGSAKGRHIPVQAELGGLSATIVMPDADPASAARMLAGGAFGYAGQRCTSTRRIITVGHSKAFIEALVAETRALNIGDPADESVAIGPVINRMAKDRVHDAVRRAKAEGGRVLNQTNPIPDGEGWFTPCFLVDGVDPGHFLAQEEVFGPVCAVMSAKDFPEAVDIANSTRYGLAAAVITSDQGVVAQAIEKLDAGMIRINAPTSGADPHVPFTGVRCSAYGPPELGSGVQDFYTKLRTITTHPPLACA